VESPKSSAVSEVFVEEDEDEEEGEGEREGEGEGEVDFDEEDGRGDCAEEGAEVDEGEGVDGVDVEEEEGKGVDALSSVSSSIIFIIFCFSASFSPSIISSDKWNSRNMTGSWNSRILLKIWSLSLSAVRDVSMSSGHSKSEGVEVAEELAEEEAELEVEAELELEEAEKGLVELFVAFALADFVKFFECLFPFGVFLGDGVGVDLGDALGETFGVVLGDALGEAVGVADGVVFGVDARGAEVEVEEDEDKEGGAYVLVVWKLSLVEVGGFEEFVRDGDMVRGVKMYGCKISEKSNIKKFVLAIPNIFSMLGSAPSARRVEIHRFACSACNLHKVKLALCHFSLTVIFLPKIIVFGIHTVRLCLRSNTDVARDHRLPELYLSRSEVES
jgi:hypothetical protein